MARKRIVIVGSNFAGFTAAMELAKCLDGRHDIIAAASGGGSEK